MLLIIIGLGVVVYAYATGAFDTSTSNISSLLVNSGNKVAEKLKVVQSSFNTTSYPGTATQYAMFTLTNSQTSATPSPFQQMFTMNPSLYTSYEATDLGNIRFYLGLSNYAFSTPVDSWMESVSSPPANLATSATFWLNLPSGIPASSGVNVYMDFQSVSTEFDGVAAGEAPQLSTTYGQYDNGALVFTQYGGASWSGFTFQSGTWTHPNGYLQQTGTTASGGTAGGAAALIESASYSVSSSYVLEMAFNYTTHATARVGIVADATPIGTAGSGTADTSAYRFVGQQNNNGPGFVSFVNDQIVWVANNAYQGAVSTSYSMQVTDAAGSWSGNLYSGYSVTGSVLASLASTAYTTANQQGATSGYVGISAGYYNTTAVISNPINVQWFRMRAYPPNGAMPTASSGSVSQNNPPQAGADLFITNSGSYPANVAAIYVENEQTLTLVTTLLLTTPVTIQSGSVQEIAVDFTPTNQIPYQFVIATQLGNDFSYTAVG
ncbi:MAG: hypothetical protein ABSE82_12415 [Nitrososphaerales archaeon]|jgi:hypothetical protein